MNHLDLLPKDFESVLDLPSGSVWLVHIERVVEGHPMDQEYRVHVESEQIAALLDKISGVARTTIYLKGRRRVGFDFMVPIAQTKQVLEILSLPVDAGLP